MRSDIKSHEGKDVGEQQEQATADPLRDDN